MVCLGFEPGATDELWRPPIIVGVIAEMQIKDLIERQIN